MAHATIAPSGARRSLIPFSVKLRSAGRAVQFVALARSSGEALCNALALPNLAPPVSGSVKPVCSPADAQNIYRLKLAIADLVE